MGKSLTWAFMIKLVFAIVCFLGAISQVYGFYGFGWGFPYLPSFGMLGYGMLGYGGYGGYGKGYGGYGGYGKGYVKGYGRYKRSTDSYSPVHVVHASVHHDQDKPGVHVVHHESSPVVYYGYSSSPIVHHSAPVHHAVSPAVHLSAPLHGQDVHVSGHTGATVYKSDHSSFVSSPKYEYSYPRYGYTAPSYGYSSYSSPSYGHNTKYYSYPSHGYSHYSPSSYGYSSHSYHYTSPSYGHSVRYGHGSYSVPSYGRFY